MINFKIKSAELSLKCLLVQINIKNIKHKIFKINNKWNDCNIFFSDYLKKIWKAFLLRDRKHNKSHFFLCFKTFEGSSWTSPQYFTPKMNAHLVTGVQTFVSSSFYPKSLSRLLIVFMNRWCQAKKIHNVTDLSSMVSVRWILVSCSHL